jgi:adenosylcobinamide kinase/adenosylcobinamide-phosphate guanylyltransferase
MLTLLVGGARSGKSTLAVQMAEHHGGAVQFIATAEPFDADLRDRIAKHRAERPAGWITVEAPVALGAAVDAVPADAFLVVDCLTVWLGNLIAGPPGSPVDHEHETASLVDALRRRARSVESPTVVVSNEVGMGVHPETDLGRRYRDELGRVNQAVASIADRTLLLVAGRAVRLDNPWDLLR